MKLAMNLTMEALVRALRAHMHRMAEDIEAGYARDAARTGERDRRAAMGARDDDVSGD